MPETTPPPWYKTAIIYEVPVRAFCDSNGDGIGDFNGLTSKLDYLSDLGVTALWLLPFYPSPLRDGGYDIADYGGVHPQYGTLDDFKRFLDEAHRRDLKVITELVLNHTSNEHAWFQRARRAPPGSPERDMYVWSDDPSKYSATRIIFKDFEASNWSWDPVANAYYWHRFYAHQPDLNFDHPHLQDTLLGVVDSWLAHGVDGLRLDAVPYLYEREGTTCENLPETHVFLKKLRAHVDSKFKGRMLLAEANMWPADAAAYFGDGDECHMNFHFPLMPRMFMALQMEDRFPIVDILRQTPELHPSCQWATFLRNHDELTLEMVTDEERDYMYRVYTEDPVARINLGIRRRLAPLVRSRRKVELLNGLLLSLPGTPVLYYGDEIGMGDNVYLGDRDGVRTPMQWSADRNAGFSRANPQRLHLPIIIDPEFHYEAICVDSQQQNPASLLRWMKRLIDVRKQDEVFGIGDFTLVPCDNPSILAFVRGAGDHRVLVAANLSRHTQHANLELAQWAGRTPVEMFGRSSFPVATERPYPLSFAAHAFYWFQLELPGATSTARPSLSTRGSWPTIVEQKAPLVRALSSFCTGRRWFRGKARKITGSRLVDVLVADRNVQFCVIELDYAEGAAERYLIPLAFATGEQASQIESAHPGDVIANLVVRPDNAAAITGILYDALATGEAAAVLLESLRGGPSIGGNGATFIARPSAGLEARMAGKSPAPRAIELDQTNSTVTFGDRVILKVFRQLEEGINAEVEVGEFLSAQTEGNSPVVLGSIAWASSSAKATSAIGIVHELVPNQGSAWGFLVHELEALLERTLSGDALSGNGPPTLPPGRPLQLMGVTSPDGFGELGGYLRHARRLGERTATMHNVLGAGTGPDFAPEGWNAMYQNSLYQGARGLMQRTFELLEKLSPGLPVDVQGPLQATLAARTRVDTLLRTINARPVSALRIRSHGDLHLGQVLFTGDDFVIIDFEGEPARPLRERRYKRSPLRDVAGMLRSFSYVAESTLRAGRLRERDHERMRPWAVAWTRLMSAAYLEGYFATVNPKLVPAEADRELILNFYTAEKCIYEIGYELNNRPAWLPIPLAGLQEMLAGGAPR